MASLADMEWMQSFAGFLVGTMVGMTGVGGGALMTPILVLVFGFSPTLAVGTDLWFAAITKSVGGITHHRSGNVDWEVLRRLLLGSVPASLLTLIWLGLSGPNQFRQGFILTALGGVLLLTALSIFLQKKIHAFAIAKRIEFPERFIRAQPTLTVIAGGILGFLITSTSVGAGALGAVVLLYLYPLRMKPAAIVGTDIIHAIPLTIIAGTGHMWMGNVDLTLLAMLLLGSIPGVMLGSLLGTRVPETLLKMIIAVMLSFVGMKLLLQ